MTKGKVNSNNPTKKELLAQLKEIQLGDKFAIEMALKSFQHDGCIKETRRLYVNMCLQFCSDPKNGTDDDDHLTMLTLFELLNCL